jgi:pimeloyl-ACP methyl ester carboxylesterase
VRALILIDTQAGVEDPEVLPLFEAMTADWEANGPAQGTLDYAATAILGPGADEEAWKSLWASRPNHWAGPAAHPLLTRDDITERLCEISCPTLVIHGEADASIPVEKAEALVAGIPGAQPLVLIPGAGHASNLTHPQIANPAIRAFLDSLGT